MKTQKNGFSLVEVMVSAGILAFILAGVIGFAQYMLRTSSMSASSLQLQDLENQVRGALSNADLIWASANDSANGGTTGDLYRCLSLETDATLGAAATSNVQVTSDCSTATPTNIGTLAELRKSQFPVLAPPNTTLQLSDFNGFRPLSVVSRTAGGSYRYGAPEISSMGSHARTFFTLEGKPCVGVTAESIQCPIRVGILWRPRCDGTSTTCSMADSIDFYYSIYSPYWDPTTKTYSATTPTQLSNAFPSGIAPLSGRVNLMTRGAENKLTVAVASSSPTDAVQNCLVLTFDNALPESRVYCSQGTNSYTSFTTTTNFTSAFWVTSPCTFSAAMVQIVTQRSGGSCNIGSTIGPAKTASSPPPRPCGVYIIGLTSVGGQMTWQQTRIGSQSSPSDPRTSIQAFLTEAATANKTNFKTQLLNVVAGAATMRETDTVNLQGFRYVANESFPPKKYTFEFVDGADWSSLTTTFDYKSTATTHMKFSITAGNATGVPTALDPVKGCQLVPFGI